MSRAVTLLACVTVSCATAYGQTVDFTGVDLATVSSVSGQNFAYSSGGGSGTINVRLVSGVADQLQPGSAPDANGFYALQSDTNSASPMTFRFTFDTDRKYVIKENETLQQHEEVRFLTDGTSWEVSGVANVNYFASPDGKTATFVGTADVGGPYGEYTISSFSHSFDYTITNDGFFGLAGSAISLEVIPVPEPASTLAVAGLFGAVAHVIRRRSRKRNISPET